MRPLLPCILLLGLSVVARADGGVVQTSQLLGDQRVTVFASPNPLRAGLIDVSVWVQDAASGATLPDAHVGLALSSPETGGGTLQAVATHAAATNKLFVAAIIDVPEPGSWHLTTKVSGKSPRGKPFECQLHSTLSIAEPLPKWRSMWLWYSWPAIVVLLFVWRKSSTTPA